MWALPLQHNGLRGSSRAPGHRFNPWHWHSGRKGLALRCRSQPRLGSELHMPQGGQKRKKKKVDFLCVDLASCNLANSHNPRFFIDTHGTVYTDNHANSFSFQSEHFLFIFLALANTSRRMWNISGVNTHSCLAPHLRGKAFLHHGVC